MFKEISLTTPGEAYANVMVCHDESIPLAEATRVLQEWNQYATAKRLEKVKLQKVGEDQYLLKFVNEA
jgi:hypothetical protein